MKYRTLGKDFTVSAVGLGCIEFQAGECVAAFGDARALVVQIGVVAQMPVAAEVGSGDERDELGSG